MERLPEPREDSKEVHDMAPYQRDKVVNVVLGSLRTIVSKIYSADPIGVRLVITGTAKNELSDVVRNGITSSKRGSTEMWKLLAGMSTNIDRITMKDFLMNEYENEYYEEGEGKMKFQSLAEVKPHTNRRKRFAPVSFRDEELGDDSEEEAHGFDTLCKHWKRRKINGGLTCMYCRSRKYLMNILWKISLKMLP